MEGFHEDSFVRPRINFDQKIVNPLEKLIFARGQVMQRRIFNDESAIPHGVVDLHYGVARSACQAGICLGSVNLLLDRDVKLPIEEHGMIMATGTPLRGFHANRVLHVLDGLSVPLIIEGRKMVHGRVPLVINVGVTALAGFRSHEEV